jgi:ABC-type polysaccharide/polyol phosphate export permease
LVGSDLLASRELAWRLLVRNISAHYRQSLLGYAWAFVPPLFTTLIWVFLSSQNILDIGNNGMPYPLFVLTGTILWQNFVEALLLAFLWMLGASLVLLLVGRIQYRIAMPHLISRMST